MSVKGIAAHLVGWPLFAGLYVVAALSGLRYVPGIVVGWFRREEMRNRLKGVRLQ